MLVLSSLRIAAISLLLLRHPSAEEGKVDEGRSAIRGTHDDVGSMNMFKAFLGGK